MKKIILILASILTIGVALQSCKALQSITNTVCGISATVCPVITDILGLGASVTVTPTNNTHQVLVTANGVAATICDVINGICPVVDSALAHNKSVTIVPVKHSTSAVNASKAGVVYVTIKFK